MSWISGYKPKASTSQAEDREEKRKKLQAERELRAKQRSDRQKQLQDIIQSQKEAEQAIQDLLEISVEVFEESENFLKEVESGNIDVEELLAPDNMAENFDVENGTDGDKALDKLGGVRCPFTKTDIDFWFSQFESQLEVIGVKSQWVKRLAL